jgi:hypothetical protein
MKQLLVAMLAALVTLSSVWLGSYLTRKYDVQKWRRDRCLVPRVIQNEGKAASV